jgi:hypothetical protein
MSPKLGIRRTKKVSFFSFRALHAQSAETGFLNSYQASKPDSQIKEFELLKV